MNCKLLDPYVAGVLQNCGWYEGRRINISREAELLTREGYVLSDCARKVLENLGGISVRDKGDCSHSGAQFDFDFYGSGSGEFDRLAIFETLAGERLFPLGEMVQSFAYIGESGRCYFGCYDELYLACECIEDYLNNLFDLSHKPVRFS